MRRDRSAARWVATLGWMLLAALPARGAPTPRLEPKVSHERIVLHTIAGDIVLALWPGVAPRHSAQILRLMRAGVYDGTHFFRLIPGFVAQTSVAEDRLVALSPEQGSLIHRIPAELNSAYTHRRGVLSMAHESDDADSAQTSFSVLLDDAPHLDGRYTVFGEVVAGMDVVEEMLKVARHADDAPNLRLTIASAEVFDDPSALRSIRLRGPQSLSVLAPVLPGGAGLVAGLALIVLLGTAGVMLRERFAGRFLSSLLLAQVLVATFLLLVQLGPDAPTTGLGPFLFVGLLALFKLLGRFESAAAPAVRTSPGGTWRSAPSHDL